MPQYLKEAECVWRKKHQSIMKMAESCGKQVVMIDIGCGPATYGIAFAQRFAAEMNKIEYVGVDTSEEMLRMGERLFDERRLSSMSITKSIGLTLSNDLRAASTRLQKV